MMDFSAISLIAVLAAAVAGFVFGGAYYMVLSKPWLRASGVACGPDGKPQGSSPAPFIVAIIADAVMAFVLAAILPVSAGPGDALPAAFLLWAGFIATTISVNYAFGQRPVALTVIDAGHWLGVLIVMALVLTLL